MKILMVCILAIISGMVHAEQLDPMKEWRCCQDPILRNPDGTIYRSSAVYNEFRRQNPCPSTGKTTGACPGWSVNHGYPLDCGGFDAVFNMLWMSNIVKVTSGIGQDRYELKIHGTGNCAPVPEGGIKYPTKHGILIY